MYRGILSERWARPLPPDDDLLMTTSHAAKFLGVSLEAMRQFGLTGVVPAVATSSARLRLFRKGDLRRVLNLRAEARYRRGQRRLAEVQTVMVKAGLKPRQFDLFGPRLRIRHTSPQNVTGRSPSPAGQLVRKTA